MRISRKIPRDALTTLTRNDWVERIISTEAFPYHSARDVERLCVNVLDWMVLQLKDERSIYFKGVGHLGMQRKSARPGRNPLTGEQHKIAPRNVVKMTQRSHTGLVPLHKTALKKSLGDFLGIGEAQAGVIYDAFLSLLEDVVMMRSRIELRGFGVFTPSLMPSREVRNPKNGQLMQSEKQVRVRFKEAKDLLENINTL